LISRFEEIKMLED
jgi:RNA-binding protein YhbY